jgi:hypothetical protein
VFLRRGGLVNGLARFPSQYLEIHNLFHATDLSLTHLSLANKLPPAGSYISNGGLLSPDSPNSLPAELSPTPRLIDPKFVSRYSSYRIVQSLIFLSIGSLFINVRFASRFDVRDLIDEDRKSSAL